MRSGARISPPEVTAGHCIQVPYGITIRALRGPSVPRFRAGQPSAACAARRAMRRFLTALTVGAAAHLGGRRTGAEPVRPADVLSRATAPFSSWWRSIRIPQVTRRLLRERSFPEGANGVTDTGTPTEQIGVAPNSTRVIVGPSGVGVWRLKGFAGPPAQRATARAREAASQQQGDAVPILSVDNAIAANTAVETVVADRCERVSQRLRPLQRRRAAGALRRSRASSPTAPRSVRSSRCWWRRSPSRSTSACRAASSAALRSPTRA